MVLLRLDHPAALLNELADRARHTDDPHSFTEHMLTSEDLRRGFDYLSGRASGHRPAGVGRSVPEPGLAASASLALTPDEAQPVSTSPAAAGSSACAGSGTAGLGLVVASPS